MGPPSDANGWTLSVTCASSLETAIIGQWVCEHRDQSILNMVSFRHVVAGSDINHWWDDGANAIAFSRGDKGFVAINDGGATVTAAIPSAMAAGNYHDLIAGGTVVVDSTGTIAVSLRAKAAIAIDVATKIP